ncbi:hypothetical protein GCM10020219_053980 [Nonomuraea dietziae]
MQNERLIPLRLHLTGEVGLLHGGIDVRVAVVLEHPEEAVEPHVDAGRLDHCLVERVETDPAGLDFGEDVSVRKQHGEQLTVCDSEVGWAGLLEWAGFPLQWWARRSPMRV